ncbi:MAG: hypothetical protein KTR24_14825, partial [Saprospiraceae bacterium]|nr:hypothetical protein [Saprospiraceae bacterium]
MFSMVHVTVSAQSVDDAGKVKVFLDCSSCDEAYFRSEGKFVNFVRDPADADLHAFIRSNYSSSGRTLQYQFIAFDRFQQQHDTSALFISNTLTSAERRDLMYQHFQW